MTVRFALLCSAVFAASSFAADVELQWPGLTVRFPGTPTTTRRFVQTDTGPRSVEQWKFIAPDGSVYALMTAPLDEDFESQRDVDAVLFNAEDATVTALKLEPRTDGRSTLRTMRRAHLGLSLSAGTRDGMGYYARFFVVDATLVQISLVSRAESSAAQKTFDAFADTLAGVQL